MVEKKAEKHIPPADFHPDIFEDVVKSHKSELERGWRILMAGIVVEVVAAFGISVISGLEIAVLNDKAADAQLAAKKLEAQINETRTNVANIDPLNQPISDVSALVNFTSSMTNFPESPAGGVPVAYLMLCETNMESQNFESAMILTANSFHPFNLMNPFTHEVMNRGYAIDFHTDSERLSAPAFFNGKPAAEIMNNVNYLKIYVNFIPHNVGAWVGNAALVINGSLRKDFFIGNQKALGVGEGGLAPDQADSGFTIIATNSTPPNITPKIK